MKQFEHIVETEVAFVADSFELDDESRASLAGWIEMMQDWLAGILCWHQMTGRYKEPVLKRTRTPGAVIAAASSAFAPTGLGTSAARFSHCAPAAARAAAHLGSGGG